MKRSTALLATGALFSSVAAVSLATVTGASAADSGGSVDSPPSAVEDFRYPHADEILKERGIRLKSGDGHITLADCDSRAGLLELWTSQESGKRFCFRVTGNSGYLSLEVPTVYGVKGNDYKVRVDMTIADTKKEVSFDINKNQWTPVGKTTDPEKRDHTLMEIFATK